MPRPAECATCLAAGSIGAIGPGVEQLEDEARGAFSGRPASRCWSSDLVDRGSGRAPELANGRMVALRRVIGTQLVAKGHHFPMLTLVGVVDADLGTAGGDLRAAERTYQLLHQVVGRAGREAGRDRHCCRRIIDWLFAPP